jgi:hypothetical protein
MRSAGNGYPDGSALSGLIATDHRGFYASLVLISRLSFFNYVNVFTSHVKVVFFAVR